MSLNFRPVEQEELKGICEQFASSISAEFDDNTFVCDLAESDLFAEEGTSQVFTFQKNVLLLPIDVPDGVELRILEENVSIPLESFLSVPVSADEHCFLSWEKVPLRQRIKTLAKAQMNEEQDDEAKWTGLFIKFGINSTNADDDFQGAASETKFELPEGQKLVIP
ncbi:Schizosaccharomyces specific protein [Schizosaccharomyces osmophilus]|uniref:Schizosaccharomyces specific protein n=1 Tax=Schizosaccharomyces osmophilus TaxID=2545709 RepID=A0AAE9WEC7_9SCHI|nr:Schizosaccharomyces specific protein [Schizosaccharomyces osmophilus]WBW73193.1 Schizosaccharomyces specific protein [Schizosaccharomyces osmophilus]